MTASTPTNYYEIFRVPRSATAEEIKSAYRQRAKDLHPDKNRGKDTTALFQLLQEAYTVLGSPERRKLYDEGNLAAAKDPETKATEAVFDPVTCDSCGCISAQPRFVQYERVVSVIFASFKNRISGVFCPKCASRRLFFNSLVTGAIGWLGVSGAFWTISALFINSIGGTRSPGINVFLLAKQAAYFMQQGNQELARLLSTQATNLFKAVNKSDKDFSLGEQGYKFAQAILAASQGRSVRLRSKWSGWAIPGRYAFLGFAISGSVWAAIFWPHNSHASYYGATQSQPPSTPPVNSSPMIGLRPKSPPPTAPEYRMVGKDGRTYRVSNTDYLRLKPIYDRLVLRENSLSAGSQVIKDRRKELEAYRDANPEMNEYERKLFNIKVDDFNADISSHTALVEPFQREIDGYNAELYRVGVPIR